MARTLIISANNYDKVAEMLNIAASAGVVNLWSWQEGTANLPDEIMNRSDPLDDPDLGNMMIMVRCVDCNEELLQQDGYIVQTPKGALEKPFTMCPDCWRRMVTLAQKGMMAEKEANQASVAAGRA